MFQQRYERAIIALDWDSVCRNCTFFSNDDAGKVSVSFLRGAKRQVTVDKALAAMCKRGPPLCAHNLWSTIACRWYTECFQAGRGTCGNVETCHRRSLP